MSAWEEDSTKELSTDASRTLPFDQESARFTTPAGISSSVVRVPVLSKRQCATLPAISTRKGSVENTPTEWRDMSAVFTASDICMGKPRGTTLVRKMMHLVISLVRRFSRLRRGSRRHTYSAATNAKVRQNGEDDHDFLRISYDALSVRSR